MTKVIVILDQTKDRPEGYLKAKQHQTPEKEGLDSAKEKARGDTEQIKGMNQHPEGCKMGDEEGEVLGIDLKIVAITGEKQVPGVYQDANDQEADQAHDPSIDPFQVLFLHILYLSAKPLKQLYI